MCELDALGWVGCARALLPPPLAAVGGRGGVAQQASYPGCRSSFPPFLQGLDVGPESITMIQAALGDCKTVLWNGPMGCARGLRV